MEPDERSAVQKAMQGDKNAYGALIAAYQGMVFATALNITGNYSDSDDVVQESFLHAYQSLRTLSDPSKFAAWLHTLARRVALQFLAKKRRVRTTELDKVGEKALQSDMESPAGAYARQELSRILWDEVAGLPPKTREAILLYYQEGFTVRRAAEYLDISEGAMKMRLEYGREKLRAGLTQQVQAELTQHRPSREARKAILTALPSGNVMGGGFLTTVTTRTGLVLAALSAKHMVVAGLTLVAVLAALLVANDMRKSRLEQPISPVVADNDEQGGKDRPLRIAGSSSSSGADALTGQPRETAEEEGAGGMITGAVVDAVTGQGIPDVEVQLRDAATRTTRTDVLGVYRFDGLPEGRFRVFCGSAEGYLEPDYLDLLRISLRASERLQNVDFALKPAVFSLIDGKVVDQRGLPAAGAEVTAYTPPDAPGGSQRVSQVSTEDGAFRIGDLRVGSEFYLQATKDVFTTRREGPLVLVVDGIRGVVLKLYPAGGISGEVLDTSGRAVSDRSIDIVAVRWEEYDNTRMRTCHDTRVKPGGEGQFEFTGLEAGEYQIGIDPNPEVRRSGWRPGPDDLVVELGEGERVTGVTIFFEKELENPEGPSDTAQAVEKALPMVGRVEGRVVRSDNKEPIREFLLSTRDDGLYAEAMRDGEGRFVLEDVKEELLVLCVKAKGYVTTKTVVKGTYKRDLLHRPVIQLDREAIVEGAVTDSAGNPVVGATIFVEVPVRLDESRGAVPRSQADGSFRLDALPPGPQRVFAIHPSFSLAWTDIALHSGETVTAIIVMSEGGMIEGVVTVGGESKRDMTITAVHYGLGNQEEFSTLAHYLHSKGIADFLGCTDGEGRFQLKNLPPGQYSVYTFDPFFDGGDNWSDEWRIEKEATVASGMATEIHIELPRRAESSAAGDDGQPGLPQPSASYR